MFVPKPILSVCPQVLWEARLACNPNASTQRPPGQTSAPAGAHSILGNFVAYRSGLFRSQITQAPVHLFRSLSSLTHNSLKAFLLVPSSPRSHSGQTPRAHCEPPQPVVRWCCSAPSHLLPAHPWLLGTSASARPPPGLPGSPSPGRPAPSG